MIFSLSGREECDCPPQYSGSSCESCSQGYYGNYSDNYSCSPCPCHDHQDRCYQDSHTRKVVCVCTPGWVGQFCQTRPLSVNIQGPKVQSVRPGQTVKFDCSAAPKIKIEVKMMVLTSHRGLTTSQVHTLRIPWNIDGLKKLGNCRQEDPLTPGTEF